MAPNLLTLLAGIFISLGAAFLGLREIALGSSLHTLPTAPFWVRTSMFIFMVVLAGRGADILLSLQSQHPIRIDGGGTVAAFCMALYHMSMLWNVLRQNYPARVWKKIRRMERLAQCRRNGWALALLSGAGFTVWAPNEGVLPDPDI